MHLDPILKKKDLDTEDLQNFRPVSQGAFLNKLVDRALHQQMSEYLAENGLESQFQTGYKSHHSTEILLLALNDHLIRNYDNAKGQILVTLDFSSAFDCIRIDQLKET